MHTVHSITPRSTLVQVITESHSLLLRWISLFLQFPAGVICMIARENCFMMVAAFDDTKGINISKNKTARMIIYTLRLISISFSSNTSPMAVKAIRVIMLMSRRNIITDAEAAFFPDLSESMYHVIRPPARSPGRTNP